MKLASQIGNLFTHCKMKTLRYRVHQFLRPLMYSVWNASRTLFPFFKQMTSSWMESIIINSLGFENINVLSKFHVVNALFQYKKWGGMELPWWPIAWLFCSRGYKLSKQCQWYCCWFLLTASLQKYFGLWNVESPGIHIRPATRQLRHCELHAGL